MCTSQPIIYSPTDQNEGDCPSKRNRQFLILCRQTHCVVYIVIFPIEWLSAHRSVSPYSECMYWLRTRLLTEAKGLSSSFWVLFIYSLIQLLSAIHRMESHSVDKMIAKAKNCYNFWVIIVVIIHWVFEGILFGPKFLMSFPFDYSLKCNLFSEILKED